jgi:hypothetical protein
MLREAIGRVGPISKIHIERNVSYINSGVFTLDEMLAWAKNFAEDPWRKQNIDYRTVAHFLRNPDKWVESKVKGEGEAWQFDKK